MADAEYPPKQECALAAFGFGDKVHKQCDADQRQRPKVERREAGCRNAAGHEQHKPAMLLDLRH